MNVSRIKELIRLLEESGVEEIEVSRWGTRIRVSKSGNSFYSHTPEFVPPREAPVVTANAPAQAEQAPAAAQKQATNLKEIKSPMVGTFYRAAAPGAEPFVEVGGLVEVGRTVCVIEAMKLMNEIQAEVSGKVVRVMVDNAQPVEYGQALFLVEP
ncbi:MAG: acetyl-CoA carboxylase biotin carboxyl carrier protein [Candidatus Eisenbacteria bacterium]